jgi:hypothetical protein
LKWCYIIKRSDNKLEVLSEDTGEEIWLIFSENSKHNNILEENDANIIINYFRSLDRDIKLKTLL